MRWPPMPRRRWWCASAAALAVAAALAARRHDRRRTGTPLIATGRAGRNLELARLGSRVGRDAAANRARWVVAPAARRADLDAELTAQAARQVAASLGELKGVLMKAGQLMSFVDDGVPEAVRAALAQLQHDAPAMAPALAAAVVTAELGAPPERLFAEWCPRPFAAASIGQVHRARTQDGRAVAVKVQYPGIDTALRADLASVELPRLLAPLMFPQFDVDSLVAELRDRLAEELDYDYEAANQRAFATAYAGHPFIEVPGVVDELSSARVLTTELASGARFADLERWSQDERDLAAEAIFRFVFRSLYRLRMFNGDPHPGNYLFQSGGRVTFLDFGLVRYFEPSDVDRLFGPIRARLDGASARDRRLADEEAGWLVPGAPLADEQACAYTDLFWAPFVRDDHVRFSPEASSAFVREILFDRGRHGDAFRWSLVPPRFLMLQRINLGLVAILGRLRAGANWRRIAEEMWPGIDGPPASPLGEAEAAWLTRSAVPR